MLSHAHSGVFSGRAVLVEELTAFEQVDSQKDSSTSAAEPLPANLEAFSGTYTNPGYGTVSLCTTESTSRYCRDVLTSFAPFIKKPSPPELYAAWQRVLSTHVRLTHRSAAEFSVQVTSLFPEGYGANKTAFETNESGQSEASAVFILEGEGNKAEVRGFGIEIDAEAVEARKRAGARDVRDWADAWFEKVKS